MQITFGTSKLKKQYEKRTEAVKAYGEDVGKRYVGRINIIKSMRTLDELMKAPSLRCHPLKGNRAGQWAVNLTGFVRLIFTLSGDNLEIVCIEEVSKHYDD